MSNWVHRRPHIKRRRRVVPRSAALSPVTGTFDVTLPIISAHTEDDGGGWTDTTLDAAGVQIFVDQSGGDDTNDGLTERNAVQSIAKGKTLLRDGEPDQLLLKKGETWTEDFGNWSLSGKSNTERMLIGSYGVGARPIFKTSNDDGFVINGGPGTSVQYLNIIGLEMYPHTRDETDERLGIRILQTGHYITVEDCEIYNYSFNIIYQGNDTYHNTNLTIRRNVIRDSYRTTADGHSSGIFINKCEDVLIEENVIYHNGWRPGDTDENVIFNHNIYIQYSNGPSQNGGTISVLGNIIGDGSSHGVQLRSGGTVSDNLFVQNPISILIGTSSGSGPSDGVPATAIGNVIVEGRDIKGAADDGYRGHAFDLQDIKSGEIVRNLMIHETSQGTAAHGIRFTSDSDGVNVGISDTTLCGNVAYDHGKGLLMDVNSSHIDTGKVVQEYNNVVIEKSQLQSDNGHAIIDNTEANATQVSWNDNEYHSSAVEGARYRNHSSNYYANYAAWDAVVSDTNSSETDVSYTDPTRDIASWHETAPYAADTGSIAGFMAEAITQSRDTWRSKFTAAEALTYFRTGFDIPDDVMGMVTASLPIVTADFSGVVDNVTGTFAVDLPAITSSFDGTTVEMGTALASRWVYSRRVHQVATAAFTRPANATAYTAGDAIYAEDAGVIGIPSCTRKPGGAGRMTHAVLTATEAMASPPDLELLIFNDEPSTFADNAAMTLVDSDIEKWLGTFTFLGANATVFGSGASGQTIYSAQLEFPKPFVCISGMDMLCALLRTSAFTPAASTEFRIKIGVDQD